MSKLQSKILTEDEVRDIARSVLGLESSYEAQSNVGQITTFNQLGFKGVNDRPDGWYLPFNHIFPAIILETKHSNVSFSNKEEEELLKNCTIVSKKYNKHIGILYNGYDVVVFKNGKKLTGETKLFNKEYYLGLFTENTIDKNEIYKTTKRINDSLHFNFGVKNLYHRMIFTACALVAKRYGAVLVEGMSFNTFRSSILDKLTQSLTNDIQKNNKLDTLLRVYGKIDVNVKDDQEAINSFIEDITKISELINSDYWNGEDVMAIFFNEFNRYKKKSELGQVFTPDHITSFMYRLIDIDKDDNVLDAACGSGAFLVKSMCNMIKEAGGLLTAKARNIKDAQLFGIEKDEEIYALACANMLIHKDGKTNLKLLDSRSVEASEWIKSKNINKVLMNPPFENKYGCLDIVENVLDSVSKNVLCAFILPETKLDRNPKQTRFILKRHRLEKIIKLPKKIFSGVETSIFIFRTGVEQKGQEIFSCYIKDDGHETIKNQGRHDLNGTWNEIEDKWIDIIKKQSGDDSIQWLDPNVGWSYVVPDKPFQISEKDFKKTIFEYILFENNIDETDFKNAVLEHVLFDR